MTKKRNFGLDALRVLAISMVMLCHFAQLTIVLGILGVSLFFALSGFLVGGLFIKELNNIPVADFGFRSLWQFLRRRWYRTLPNFYLFLLVNCLLELAIRNSINIGRVIRYAAFLQNFASRMPGFFLVSWSLAVEEWFYIFFPLAAVLALKWSKSINIGLGVSVASLVSIPVAIRFAISPFVHDWVGEMSMVVVCRLDAIMYGVIVSWIHIRNPALFLRLSRFWAAPVLCIGIEICLSKRLGEFRYGTQLRALELTIVPIACALLVPVFYHLQPIGQRAASLIKKLSQWSYSIYLVHPAILTLIIAFIYPRVTNFGQKLCLKVAALGVTLIASMLLFEFYETPILSIRDRRKSNRLAPNAAISPDCGTEDASSQRIAYGTK